MFKYEKFNLSKQTTSPIVEKVVEFTPPSVEMANITKVLSLSVDGKALSCEARDGYSDMSGRANFKLMYLDADGAAKGVDYNADFSMKIECACHEGDTLSAKIDIVEADVSAGEKLALSAVIQASVKFTSTDEIEALVDAERCFKTMKKGNMPIFKMAKSEVIPVSDEEELHGDVERVLLLDSRCCIKKAMAGEDMVKIDGVVYAAISYCNGSSICTKQMEIPIIEEIEMDGVEPCDIVCAEACIKNARIVLSGVTGDNIMRFECELSLKLQIFCNREADMVDDMFMLTNEVSLTRGELACKCFGGSRYFSERVSGTAILGETRPAVRDIVTLPYARSYVSKAEVTDDGFTVEGIVNTDIIYSDENGYNSVRTEVPFSVLIAGEFEKGASVICTVENISARVKRDREMEVNMTLGLAVSEYIPCKVEYISGVEVGAEKEQNTSGLSLYIASDGDEMWDICKALTATPEEVLAQNPSLVCPLKQGDKVLYFRKLQ